MVAVIGIGVGLAGAGVAAAGAVEQHNAAKASAAANAQLVAEQQQQDALRQQQMELEARRKSVEILRNQQRARALAVTTSVGQGAGLLGSNIAGAFGQIQGQTGNDELNLQQNLQLGRLGFGITSQMNQSKLALSQAQSDMAQGAALTSLGGTLVQSAGAIGRLSQGINFNFGQTTNPGTIGGTSVPGLPRIY